MKRLMVVLALVVLFELVGLASPLRAVRDRVHAGVRSVGRSGQRGMLRQQVGGARVHPASSPLVSVMEASAS